MFVEGCNITRTFHSILFCCALLSGQGGQVFVEDRCFGGQVFVEGCDITRTFHSILYCCALLSEKAGDQEGQEGRGVCSGGATSPGLSTVF